MCAPVVQIGLGGPWPDLTTLVRRVEVRLNGHQKQMISYSPDYEMINVWQESLRFDAGAENCAQQETAFQFLIVEKKKNEIVCLPAHRDTCWWGANNPLKCKSLRVSLSLSPSAFTLHNSSPLSSCSPPPFSFLFIKTFFCLWHTHKVKSQYVLSTKNSFTLHTLSFPQSLA